MTLMLAIFLLLVSVTCNVRVFANSASTDVEYIINLGRQEADELRCLGRLDTILTSKWTMETNKIRIDDLGKIRNLDSLLPAFASSPKEIYNSDMEEWWMETDSPSERIVTCLREMIVDIVPLFTKSDIKCINQLFESHMVEERKMEEDFAAFLKKSTYVDLPFRQFLSFHELVRLMFENRNIDSLSGQERGVYEHVETHLYTEADKDRQMFIMQQDCDWDRAIALREAPNSDAKFREFVSQVHNIVNIRLGSKLLPANDARDKILNLTIIHEKLEEFLQNRKAVNNRLTAEVEKLKTQRKDVQWLCEYASKLANELVKMLSSVEGIWKKSDYFSLDIWDVVKKTSAIKSALEERNDIRKISMSALATRVDQHSRCLEGFARIIKHHQRNAVVSALTNSRYLIQEFRCGEDWRSGGSISNRLCNCAGSFCVSHGLAAFRSTNYEIVRGSNGVYKIVPSRELIDHIKREKEYDAGSSTTPMTWEHSKNRIGSSSSAQSFNPLRQNNAGSLTESMIRKNFRDRIGSSSFAQSLKPLIQNDAGSSTESLIWENLGDRIGSSSFPQFFNPLRQNAAGDSTESLTWENLGDRIGSSSFPQFFNPLRQNAAGDSTESMPWENLRDRIGSSSFPQSFNSFRQSIIQSTFNHTSESIWDELKDIE